MNNHDNDDRYDDGLMDGAGIIIGTALGVLLIALCGLLAMVVGV